MLQSRESETDTERKRVRQRARERNALPLQPGLLLVCCGPLFAATRPVVASPRVADPALRLQIAATRAETEGLWRVDCGLSGEMKRGRERGRERGIESEGERARERESEREQEKIESERESERRLEGHKRHTAKET